MASERKLEDGLPPRGRPSTQGGRLPPWGWLWLMLVVLLPATGGAAWFSHLSTLNSGMLQQVAERQTETRLLLAQARSVRLTERRLRDYGTAPTLQNQRALEAELARLSAVHPVVPETLGHDLIGERCGEAIAATDACLVWSDRTAQSRAAAAKARASLTVLLADIPDVLRDAPAGSTRDRNVELLRRMAGLVAAGSGQRQILAAPDREAFTEAAWTLRAESKAEVEIEWIGALENRFERCRSMHEQERRDEAERRANNAVAAAAFVQLHEAIEGRLSPQIQNGSERLAGTLSQATSTAGTYFAAFTLLGLLAGAAAIVAFSRPRAQTKWEADGIDTQGLRPNEELEDLGSAFNRMVENLAHSESLLREKEARLRMILETAADGIVTINQFGAIESYNAKASQIFGYREIEVLGKGAGALMPEPFGPTDDELEAYLRQGVQAILGEVREVEGRRQDGATFPMEMVVSEARVGKRTTFTSIVRDITERKKVEERRAKLIEALESKNAEMERFTYTVSHDLKSPLITIRGFLGLLEKDMEAGRPERVRADLSHIHSAVANMQNLLSELLELSRVGRIVNEPTPLELKDLIQEALDRVAGPLAEKLVEVSLGELDGQVMGDGVRLIEVFQNLIENAVKFSGPDNASPLVSVSVRSEGDDLVSVVEDNGVGIDPRYHERIFGLFERLDQSNEGTGIGLALVKRIVELHGGTVWVESQGQGSGSRFCVRLPRKGKDHGMDS